MECHVMLVETCLTGFNNGKNLLPAGSTEEASDAKQRRGSTTWGGYGGLISSAACNDHVTVRVDNVVTDVRQRGALLDR